MAGNSQKFIARNRAPRVQIEYDVELYGAEKKVQLPFVMGVMSDLLGKSNVPQPAVADRKFLEIDVDNFDSRMRSMAPRASFTVPNTLTGEGNMAIDLTFESMKDFSPGAIASKVDALRPLLEARTQLQTLMAYMDGKSGAENLIEQILQNPALLSTLSKGEAASEADQAAALDSLRGLDLPETETDQSAKVLAALAENAPAETEATDAVTDTLSALAATAPAEVPADDGAETDAALAALAATTPTVEERPGAETEEALEALRDLAPVDETPDEKTNEVLTDLAQTGGQTKPEEVSSSAEVLQDLAASVPAEHDTPDEVADILQDLEFAAPEPQEAEDNLDDVLGALEVPDLEGLETDTDAEIGAILEGLATQDTAPEPEEDLSDLLGELAAAAPAEGESEETDLSDILGSLDEIEPTSEGSRDLGEILADVAAPLPEETATDQTEEDLAEILGGLDLGGDPEISEDNLQDVLGDLVESESDTDAEDSAAIDLDDVLAGLDLADEEPEAEQDLADVLSGLAAETEPEDTSSEDDLDAVLAGVSLEEEPQEEEDLDSLLSGLGESPEEGEADGELEGLLAEASDEELDLDALLGGDAAEQGASSGDDALDLDDLLGDLGDDPAEDSGLDDLLAGLDEADDPEVPGLEASDDLSDLDDLLGDLGDEAPDSETAEGSAEDSPAEEKPAVAEPEFAYGTMAADRPDAQKLTRRRFRIALFGDFSGRTARGQVETGDALAARLAIVLDPDTVEEVIESFASELILPLCKDEAGGISVKLSEFDDLHPDELFENVALFSELVSLRKQLQSGVTVDHASRSLATWAAQYGTPLRVPKRSSPSNAVPADRRLSAFQQLIGDSENSLREASPLDEMLARIVGPHIRALPNPELAGMQEAVDAALSDAMRLVLHHPEFQSLEAQWRSLDLIARSVEVDDNLEVVLYDVSAEELAADLAAQDDLSVSGLTRLLTEEPMDPELGRGGYSALIGLYGFEEIPPHAELLGRIARVAAHVDAPFFTSLSPEFLKTAKKDRPPLVSQAWDTLQQMPEAGHLGLSSPRFLLRRPYGAKSDPVDVFEFEEFSEAEGLRGMLWGNPAVLVTILLARSFKENGASMQLGSIMSLGDMPFHTVIDRFGDQVALPCTERNIDLDKIAHANERGVMAVSAVKGRDELRLTSFSSVAGGEILGPWTGVPAPEPSPPDPREKAGIAVPKSEAPSVATEESDDLDLSDLGLDDLDLDDLGGGDDAEDDGLGDLDDLLAGFGDDDAGDDSDDDEMDEELAALLADL